MKTEYTVKSSKGYYCGHPCGARATWKPKFKLLFTNNIERATKVSRDGAYNLVTNLFLMGEGYSTAEQVLS